MVYPTVFSCFKPIYTVITLLSFPVRRTLYPKPNHMAKYNLTGRLFLLGTIGQFKPGGKFMVKQFKSRLLMGASAFMAVSMAQSAVAQDTVTTQQPEVGQADETKTLDVVVVRGLRGSIAAGLDRKRNADQIVDAIVAEDIGKTTDQNIAEALQRVTGISINRTDGEGSTISARGAGANYNNIVLDGVALSSSGENQAVDLSQFSADVLESISVIKTPSASTDEGSLGATVRLDTFKPLNIKKNRRNFSFQARDNPFGEGKDVNDVGTFGDYKMSMALSQKLFDNKLGVSFVGTKETSTTRRDEYFLRNHELRQYPNAVGAISLDAIDLNNFDPLNPTTADGSPIVWDPSNPTASDGVIIRSSDIDGDGELESPLRMFIPNQARYNIDKVERDRDTLTGTVQYRPTDTTDVYGTVTWSQQDITRLRDSFNIGVAGSRYWDPTQLVIDPETNTVVSAVYSQDTRLTRLRYNADGTPVTNAAGDHLSSNTPNQERRPGVYRLWARDAQSTVENIVYAGGIKQELGDFTINFKGGVSRTFNKTNNDIEQRIGINVGARQGVPYTTPAGVEEEYSLGFTCDAGLELCPIYVNDGLGDEPSQFALERYTLRDNPNRDIRKSLYLDIDWDREFGPISKISFGAKWTNRFKKNRVFETAVVNSSILGAEEDENGDTPSIFDNVSLEPWVLAKTTPKFGQAFGLEQNHITDGWMRFDILGLQQFVEENTAVVPFIEPRLGNQRDIEEDVLAGYLQADFALFDGDVTGNFGVRVAQTEVAGLGYSGVQYRSGKNYTNGNNRQAFPDAATVDEANNLIWDFLGTPTCGLDVSRGNNCFIGNVVSAFAETNDTHEYTNVLPSLNVNWAATDDVILRFAASRSMARPRIDQLNPSASITENPWGPRSSASIGNTRLSPLTSDNLDLSAEWYFAEESLFAVTLFNKEMKDFEDQATSTGFWRDVRGVFFDDTIDPDILASSATRTDAINADESYGFALENPGSLGSISDLFLPFTLDANAQPAGCMPNREFRLNTSNAVFPLGCDVIDVRQTRNGSGGYVRGAEVQLQHNFAWAPGLLSNTGFLANYTYADSQTDLELVRSEAGAVELYIPELPLEGTSEHTFNITAFYEDEDYMLRLAYNTRSDYLSNRNGSDNTVYWIEGTESLDLSASWQITNGISASLQAQNLTDSVTRSYSSYVGDGVPELSNTAPFEGGFDAPSLRTRNLINTGTIYRLGLNFNF